MNELISVIVPVYNVENRLDRCIESLVNQSYPHLEIILVDDESKDHSGDICNQWREKDNRIVVMHKINGGTASARNVGLDIAKGEWIAFVDSDDYVESDMYECLLNEGKALKADIVIGGLCVEADGKGYSAYKTPFSFQKQYSAHEWMKNYYLNDRTCGMTTCVCNKLYRKSIFGGGVRFLEGNFYEDDEVVAHIYTNDYQIAVLDRPFYHYVKNPKSKTNSTYSEKKWRGLEIYYQRIEAFQGWDNALAAQSARRFCNLYIEHYYKAKQAGVIIKEKEEQMYTMSMRYYRDFYGINKTYIRFLVFQISPWLYGKLTVNSI